MLQIYLKKLWDNLWKVINILLISYTLLNKNLVFKELLSINYSFLQMLGRNIFPIYLI